MIIRNYDGRGNSYDTEDPTTGPYISLFTIYGEANSAAYEAIKNTPYSIADGREVVTMTPAEAFAYLNSDHHRKGNFFYNPGEAEAARRILEYSKEDYRRTAPSHAEAPQEGHKDAMKHNNTKGYFEDLKSAYTRSRAAYEELIAIQADENDKYSQIAEGHAAGRVSERDFTIAKANHITAEDTINHSLEAARATLAENAATTRAELAEYLADKYRVKADGIDQPAIDLLNTGICTAAELAHMAEAYKGNATMTRVIAKHAAELEKNSAPDSDEQKAARELGYKLNHANNGQAELEAFDNLANWADRGIDNSGEYSTRVFNNRFAEVYNATEKYIEGI